MRRQNIAFVLGFFGRWHLLPSTGGEMRLTNHNESLHHHSLVNIAHRSRTNALQPKSQQCCCTNRHKKRGNSIWFRPAGNLPEEQRAGPISMLPPAQNVCLDLIRAYLEARKQTNANCVLDFYNRDFECVLLRTFSSPQPNPATVRVRTVRQGNSQPLLL